MIDRRIDRKCVKCGAECVECMGGTLPRDICRAIDGKIEWFNVRELCGPCNHIGVSIEELDSFDVRDNYPQI